MEKISVKLEKAMTKDELKALTKKQAKAIAHKAAETISPWLTKQGSARFDKYNDCWIVKFGWTTFELTTDSLKLVDSAFFSI
jgi:hypothetical protein